MTLSLAVIGLAKGLWTRPGTMSTLPMLTRALATSSTVGHRHCTPILGHSNSPTPTLTNLPILSVVSKSPALSGGSLQQQRRTMTSGDYVNLWRVERVVSAALLPVIPAAFLIPSNSMQYLMSLLLVLHCHWGIEAIVVDYVRPSIFGETVPKVAVGGVYLLSALALGGLMYFNYSDVGIVCAIRQLWRL